MNAGRLPSGSVLEQLRARRTSAGPAAGAIVAWLLDEADAGRLAAAALTTGSIARATGCARATVVRFVRDLGFPNFAAFQLALAVELAEAAPADPARPDTLARILHLSQTWLEATDRRLDRTALSGASALLAVARRRVWFGIGDSAHLAASADHRCAVLGLPSQAVSAGSHLTALLPSLGAGDCLVVISQSGRTRPAAGALRASGVPVIGLTSVSTSPLAKLSDYLLLTPPSDFMVGDSPYTVRAAQALVIDALLLEAGTRRGTRIEGWS